MTAVSQSDALAYPSRADLHAILSCVAFSDVTRIQRERSAVWQLSTDGVLGYGELIRWGLTALAGYQLIAWLPVSAPVQHAHLTELGRETLIIWNTVALPHDRMDLLNRRATEARRLRYQGREGDLN